MSYLTETETSLVIRLNIVTIFAQSLPLARTHARRRPRHSSVALSMIVWSMPCQTCSKRWFSSSMLCTRDCCFQRIFNRNRKLKQQLSELNALKLGLCSKISACLQLTFSFYRLCAFSSVVDKYAGRALSSLLSCRCCCFDP